VAIKLVPDLGAPLAVTAVDLTTEAMVPNYNEWIVYGMAALGYLSGWMGWGGDFLKNVGIAALPLAAKRVYHRVRGGAGASSRLTMRRVAAPISRYPAEPFQPQFRGARLT